jgi:NAD(P)-dependent dehydrogenase (short-subunit alcohol dehydrogenase family)
VLLANAGIEGVVAPATEYPPETFDRVLAVNVRGAFLALHVAAPPHGEARWAAASSSPPRSLA